MVEGSISGTSGATGARGIKHRANLQRALIGLTEDIDMELHELEAFEAVCLHRSFTQAAESLFLTQPAVTRQIASLETIKSGEEISGWSGVQKRALWEADDGTQLEERNWEGQLFIT